MEELRLKLKKLTDQAISEAGEAILAAQSCCGEAVQVVCLSACICMYV
jgi:hypothetical protein